MVAFVRDGGFFNNEVLQAYADRQKERPSQLVEVNVFEDGQQFIIDGHHRCVSIQEAGRDYLRADEYQTTKYTYEQFDTIVLSDCGKGWWVTPFDPRKSVRLPHLSVFKKYVHEAVAQEGMEWAITFIRTVPNLYRYPRSFLPRPVDSVNDLREIWHEQYATVP
jgi:hypothetical protein